MAWERELEAARQAVAAASEIALGYRRRGVAAEAKADESPVTIADRECERAISSLLRQAFPGDGILGEEGAAAESSTGRRWIIDPIDGTRDFVRGNPVWAHLIGLEADGETVVGVACLPALGYLYHAAAGEGAWVRHATGGPERLRVSGKARIEESVLFMCQLNNISKPPLAGRLVPWMSRFWAVRNFGGILDAMFLAAGMGEVWIEPKVAPWDLAAPKVILEEAGARFFNFDGGNSIHGGNGAACVPALEAEVRSFLAG